MPPRQAQRLVGLTPLHQRPARQQVTPCRQTEDADKASAKAAADSTSDNGTKVELQ